MTYQLVSVTCDGRTYRARYINGHILTPLTLEDGRILWVETLRVENPPERIIGAIRRAMANHGTIAALQGGRPVVIAECHN